MEAIFTQTPEAAATEKESVIAPVAKPDKHIWGIYIFLCLVSIVELYSASSREVASSSMGVYGPIIRHAGMLFAGFLIMLGLQRCHYRNFMLVIPVFALVSVAMMIWVMGFGEIVNGARRSFTIMGITIQPSEFIKLSAALIIALIMSRSQIKGGGVKDSGVYWAAGIVTFFGALLIKQGMTNTILLMSISLSMMIIGGVPWKRFFAVIGIYGVVVGIFLMFSHMGSSSAADGQPASTEQVVTSGDDSPKGEVDRKSTWSARLERYFGDGEPKYKQPINALNRQEMYAYMAQANGGIFGVFPGNSRETARLPLAFSDYIYSIVVEDMGLVGGVVILICYLWLLARASGIASRCSRAFPALLVIGMAVMIAFQALFHIAIVTGVFPVSGQPLPLISKGGTSILITSIAFGVMLSVSRYAVRTGGKKQQIHDEINSLPEELRADNPTQL